MPLGGLLARANAPKHVGKWVGVPTPPDSPKGEPSTPNPKHAPWEISCYSVFGHLIGVPIYLAAIGILATATDKKRTLAVSAVMWIGEKMEGEHPLFKDPQMIGGRWWVVCRQGHGGGTV